MAALDKLLFIIVLLCHAFLLEDNYAYRCASSPIYTQFFGMSLISASYLLLYLMLFSRKSVTPVSAGTRKLFILLMVTLLISLTYSLATGRLSAGAGTGLLELRVATVLVVLYYLMKKLFSKYSVEGIVRIFSRIALLSALFFFILFSVNADFMASTVDQYGRITAFESGFLFIWGLFFSYSLVNVLLSRNIFIHAPACILFGLSILCSFRRANILILMLCMVIILAFQPYISLKKHLLKLLRLFVVGVLVFPIILLSKPELLSRINPASYFNTDSEAYMKSYSSNVGHMLDLMLGLKLAKENPILGIGLGTGLGAADEDFIVSNLVHSQFLHFWLRMGILGLLLIICLYVVLLKRCRFIQRHSSNKFDIALSLSLFAFFAAQGLMSVIAPPFYIAQKLQFMFMFCFVAIEIIYQRTNHADSKSFSVVGSS